MKKIVINKCYGGFGLSHEAILRYFELKGEKIYCKKYDLGDFFHYYLRENDNESYFSIYDIDRDDPYLAKVVEEMGDKVNDEYSRLKVVEVPDDVNWEIEEYDGKEIVREVSRYWD